MNNPGILTLLVVIFIVTVGMIVVESGALGEV